MNPSTQDFVKLLEAIPVDKAILLPNNGNVVDAARQAAEICRKHVIVVPSKTIPQRHRGRCWRFNDQRNLEAKRRGDGSRHASCADRQKSPTATRAIEYNEVKVEEGHVIGLLNDELTAANETIEETLFTLLDQMGAEDLES